MCKKNIESVIVGFAQKLPDVNNVTQTLRIRIVFNVSFITWIWALNMLFLNLESLIVLIFETLRLQLPSLYWTQFTPLH